MSIWGRYVCWYVWVYVCGRHSRVCTKMASEAWCDWASACFATVVREGPHHMRQWNNCPQMQLCPRIHIAMSSVYIQPFKSYGSSQPAMGKGNREKGDLGRLNLLLASGCNVLDGGRWQPCLWHWVMLAGVLHHSLSLSGLWEINKAEV